MVALDHPMVLVKCDPTEERSFVSSAQGFNRKKKVTNSTVTAVVSPGHLSSAGT